MTARGQRIEYEDRPHFVYRHYDAAGRLLYVGLTMNPERRPYERGRRPWFDKSVRVDIVGPMSRAEGVKAERRAIADEEPLHNDRCGPLRGEDPQHADVAEFARELDVTRAEARQFWPMVANDPDLRRRMVADREMASGIAQMLYGAPFGPPSRRVTA